MEFGQWFSYFFVQYQINEYLLALIQSCNIVQQCYSWNPFFHKSAHEDTKNNYKALTIHSNIRDFVCNIIAEICQ